jgi:polyphenol oxidase
MLHAASLSALKGIRHAFFTRTGGVSQGVYSTLNGGIGSKDHADHVSENRSRMAQALGVKPEHFLTAYQIHSPDVVVVEKPWAREHRPRVDAMVTKVPGIALGVSTADCGPVLFADPQAQVIGGAHAGWRGALTGVVEATIDAMEKLGADRARMMVAIGPLIRQDSYEVGPEFVERFVSQDRSNDGFFKRGDSGGTMFDLAGYIRSRLANAGIERIEDLGLDTFAEPERFFSYRRSTKLGESDYGRHINAIALAP